MDKTPYAEDFLINQLDMIIKNIKKPEYKQEVLSLLNNREWFDIFKIAKDRKSRNYRGGILERTSAVGSMALCMYDNYPTINIDIILTGIIVAGFKDAIGKKAVYDILSNEEVKALAFKKSRKKPTVEYFIFDELFKIDFTIYSKLIKMPKN